jgi:hypothetical protein
LEKLDRSSQSWTRRNSIFIWVRCNGSMTRIHMVLVFITGAYETPWYYVKEVGHMQDAYDRGNGTLHLGRT